MKNPIRLIFAGGGTGGHLYSGIALAQVLKQKYPFAEILFVGTEYGLEKKLVPAEGFNLEFIQVAPLKGSGLLRKIKNFLQIPKSLLQSRKIIRNFNPNLVFGIGGYASGPLVLMSRLLGIKTAIIEQNAYPGFTNRILGKFAHKVFLASERAKDFFKESKVAVCGNPVRADFLQNITSIKNDAMFTLFVLGGSQGASSLNLALMGATLHLQNVKDRLLILHQTGPKDAEQVRSVYQKEGFHVEVFDFIADIKPFYLRADLVICRAGAGTVTELCVLGKPAILIPYPYAADDHQYFNAMDLVEPGAAELMYDYDLSGEKLAERIKYFMTHPEELQRRSEAALKLAKPNAASDILEQCLDLMTYH